MTTFYNLNLISGPLAQATAIMFGVQNKGGRDGVVPGSRKYPGKSPHDGLRLGAFTSQGALIILLSPGSLSGI